MSSYKFEKLEVWNHALELNDFIYELVEHLPKVEDFNLKSQILRASTSICLNIAEGSTVASDAEQIKYLKIALHSQVEVIACIKIIIRRGYLSNENLKEKLESQNAKLFAKLIAFIKSLNKP